MTTQQVQQKPTISWLQGDVEHTALWFSASGAAAPKKVQAVDDSLTADEAYRLAAQGTAMLWQGDYHNARQLLSAMARRLPTFTRSEDEDIAKAFYRFRQGRTQRARMLSQILVPLTAGPQVALRRAPDISQAWMAMAGSIEEDTVATLQEVLGAVGANEWRRNGVHIQELDTAIYPHYGTFAPIRSEYLGLVAQADLPSTEVAFDIGTGTGVLAAILARRGFQRVIATDSEPRAIACARENLENLGLSHFVEATLTDMFPKGRASLVVCNPPWLPGTANTLLDNAVYDPKSRMLKAFLNGLTAHLEPEGEGWLIISDLAEHLGLRSREQFLDWVHSAGLMVLGRLDTPARHPRSMDRNDPFNDARSKEITSLWRLGVRA